jgi:hypothetical protein
MIEIISNKLIFELPITVPIPMINTATTIESKSLKRLVFIIFWIDSLCHIL